MESNHKVTLEIFPVAKESRDLVNKRELGTKTKSQTIKLFEMTESTCCIYVCLPKCKDQVTNMVSWFACNTRVIVYVSSNLLLSRVKLW